MSPRPSRSSTAPPRAPLLAGLFLTTLAALCTEVLDIRLLSVMAWYHLSFFAVSTAMFGMAAGALRVYLGGRAFEGEEGRRALVRHALWFAIAIPICHLVNLVVRIPTTTDQLTIAALFVSTLALAIPFYVSGIVVTIVLTRTQGPIGLAYAVDLAGAAFGSVLVIPLFWWSNLTTAVLACATLAGLAALLFARHARIGGAPAALLTALLALATVWNANAEAPVTVWYVKDRYIGHDVLRSERWNAHSRVVMPRNLSDKPFYWGPGLGAEAYSVKGERLAIDGDALTVMSEWDGDPDSLVWVQHDVTSLPYQLRTGGDAAVIGVGGGRDVLTALWAKSRSVVGVEINGILLDYLENERREFARIATRPEVTLVHDEARSWLTRTEKRFDVLQMSLIDTWASTAAGGFTLTENGLYTLDAWRVFLGVLKPRGIFSVSRWYDPEKVNETTRLLALGTAALVERGIERPDLCVVLVARGQCSTLLVSNEPFSTADLESLRASCARFGFDLLVEPGTAPRVPMHAAVVKSRTVAELAAAVADDEYDYTPPTDQRPFFFNMLKARAAFADSASARIGHVLRGNLQATATLLILASISLFFVLAVVFVPLVAHGLPRMDKGSFALSAAWFAAIGLGFMLVQVAFMQRFSVYLGHPTYAVLVVLFSMILAAGAGSSVSDRLDIERRPRLLARVPLLTALALLSACLLLQPIIESTIGQGLVVRCALSVGIVAPIAFLLGLFFPLGLRAVRRLSDDALPWMWGINAAMGVLGAVIAVAISMWAGIQVNLAVALVLYAALALVGPALLRRAPASS